MHADRELIAVLFADLAGFMLLPTGGQQAKARSTQTLFQQVEAILTGQRATLEKSPGYSLFAWFRTEAGGEPAPARAVRAALGLQSLDREAQPASSFYTPRIRIGIHTGALATGPGAPAQSGPAFAGGPTLAKALHDCAPTGAILISLETCREVYGMFNVQSVPSLVLADRPEPIQAFRALGARPRSLARALRGVEPNETEFIGRAVELDALKFTLCEVLEKQELRQVTVLGEAGIGKSRLLSEFQKWLQVIPATVRLFYGRAEADMAARPFALLRDVFCSRFEIQESDASGVAYEKFARGFAELMVRPAEPAYNEQELQEQIRAVAVLLGFALPAQSGPRLVSEESNEVRHLAFQSLCRFFASASRAVLADDRPSAHAVLLVLENLHWGDDDSLDLIARLEQSCRRSPLMMLSLGRPTLVERRPDWTAASSHARLDLEPLSPEDSTLLLESVSRDAPAIPPAVRDVILTRAGGNPLAIEEFIKMLLERSAPPLEGGELGTSDTGRWTALQIPPTLHDLWQARLDALPPLERTVLQSASVIGHVFWDSAVEFLVGPLAPARGDSPSTLHDKSERLAALRSLCAKKLLHQRESSGFYGATEYTFRHELLRDVIYETMPRARRREHHARAAAWFIENSERVREFVGLVAVHFEQAGEVRSAADWYGRAGQQARAAYAPAAAITCFEKALELLAAAPARFASETGKCLEWYEGLGATLTQQARFERAFEVFGELRALAEQAGQLELQTRAWNGLAFLHERRGDNQASIQATEQAQLLAQRAGEPCRDQLIQAMQLRAWAFYRLGNAAQVLALARQTRKLCDQCGDQIHLAISYKLFGVAHLQRGRYKQADLAFKHGLELCRDSGDRRTAAAMLSNLGESARLRRDFPRAIDLYQEALDIAREIGERPSELIYLSNLAGARLGLKQFKEAEAELCQAISMTGMPKSCTLSETYRFLAEACLGQGKLAEALGAAQRAVAIGQESENRLDLAGGWRVLGQVAAAIMGGAHPNPCQSVPANALPDPSSCFAESLRIYEKIGAQDEQARTLHAWADYDREQGDVSGSTCKWEAAKRILFMLAAA